MKKYFYTLFILVIFQSFVSSATQMDTIQTSIYAEAAFNLIDSNKNSPNLIILDIRTPSEYNTDHIANAININYYDANFSNALDTLDKSKTYLMHCAAGSRSAPAFTIMKNKHFAQVYQMLGGFNGWKSAGYPTMMTTSISLVEVKNPIFFYPNPVNEMLNVRYNVTSSSAAYRDVKGTDLIIVNAVGQIVYSMQISNEELEINFQNFSNGVYNIRINNSSKKIIVNH